MATHLYWPHLMVSKYKAKVVDQCSCRRNGHPDLQAPFTGWPPCLYKDLQLFLSSHMHPPIWAYIFFFLCKRKQNTSFPQLLSGVSQRQIRWGMKAWHCMTSPVLWLFYSVPPLHTYKGEVKPGQISCHHVLSYETTRHFSPFHRHTEIREKEKSHKGLWFILHLACFLSL